MNSRRLERFLFPLSVCLLAVLQYASTFGYDYAWDDKLAITANDYTKKGVGGLRDIFTKRVSVPYKSEYRPIPQALHAVEYGVFGGGPRAGHVFNVLWYALACVTVYAFVRFSLVGLDRLLAWLVALLFVVHPLHVEVVANIKGRDEILALAFGLSSVMLLVTALEKGSAPRLAAGALCLVLALLSKSNAVTFLPVVPLVAWHRSREPGVSRRLLACIAAVVVSSAGLVALIRHGQSTISPETELHLSSTVLNNVFLWTTRPETILPTALVIVARYVRLFVVPHPLIHLYGYDQVPLSTWGDLITWLVVLGLVAVAVLVLRTWRLRAAVAFGAVFFALAYSPYSNLWYYAPDTMADRYMFIPSIGLSILAVCGVAKVGGVDLRQPRLVGARARAAMAFGAMLLVGYFARTLIGSRDWRDDATLIHNRIRYMEDGAAAQAIYGHTLLRESYEATDPAVRGQRKTAAMTAFMRAIQIYPDFQASWIAVGKLFAEQGTYGKAELAFFKAQRLEPLNPDSYFYLGTLYLAQQDPDLAIPYLEKAVLLSPTMEEAHVMLGKAYLQADSMENLGAMVRTAREWFPGNVDLAALAATYHFRNREYERAVELARAVLVRDAQNILAIAILSSPLTQELAWGGERAAGRAGRPKA